MDIKAIISHIENTADPSHAASWDTSGVHVVAERREIQKIAMALDATEDVVLRAIDWGAHLILTHHPLTLSPRIPSKEDNYTRILRLLFKFDVWLYCAHTSLDVNLNGPVSWFAREMELSHISAVEPVSRENPDIGFGIIGDLPFSMSGKSFIQKVLSLVERDKCMAIGRLPQNIERVAYCTGSGMELGKKAFKMGADVYISGDIKYHLAQELETQGLVLDVGHFSMEEKMMERWALEMAESLKKFGIDIKFFPGRDPIYLLDVTAQEITF